MPPRAKAEVELTIQATECSKKRAAALGRTGSGSSQGGNVESLTRLQRHAKPGSCRIAFDIAPKPSRRGTAPKQEGKDLDFDGAPYWAGEIDQVLMLGAGVFLRRSRVSTCPQSMYRRTDRSRSAPAALATGAYVIVSLQYRQDGFTRWSRFI
jgi:hypothetical protein